VWDPKGTLTVWTGTQNPFGVRGELVRAFGLADQAVRVVVPDFGGGFGGKHTGEAAVEAARLARAAGKPVSLRYTREEEFAWAYFRPAGVIECEASLDAAGRITSWHYVNIHSGGAALQTPYAIANNTCQNVDIPANLRALRTGSYRGLAATANAFARECFMEELAQAAGQDSLAFRVAHLQDQRLRDVLESAAKRFDWPARSAKKDPNTAVGLACATEKGGYTAACAQVTLNRAQNTFKIDHIAHVFECGKILNPLGLLQQIQGAIIQGLGPALREEMIFQDGRLQNGTFVDYKVPRFADVPSLDCFQLDRPDLPPAGAGETPLISVAPAIANAVSRALGKPIRQLPIRTSEA
jgi:isoquinoline 1-oxidoreductase